jgi:prepilin-type N-terminal cleavage/methylation domain-containing protein
MIRLFDRGIRMNVQDGQGSRFALAPTAVQNETLSRFGATLGLAELAYEESEMMKEKSESGFSLIELLIVVAVILIVTAIAVPSISRSRMAANEASVVSTLRVVNAACLSYSTTWGTGFPVSLSNLGPGKPATAATADLVSSLVSGGTKNGYVLTYTSGAPVNGKIPSYAITAAPLVPNQSGVRYFFSDQSGVIRQNTGSAATVASRPL